MTISKDDAAQIHELASSCCDVLNRALAEAGQSAPDESLMLWRLHSVAVLNALVGYILTPLLREHPELMPTTPDDLESIRRITLPPEVAEAGRRMVAEAESILARAEVRSETQPRLAEGLRVTKQRLREFDEYLAHVLEGARRP
jgi:hypothetical protein